MSALDMIVIIQGNSESQSKNHESAEVVGDRSVSYKSARDMVTWGKKLIFKL